MNHENKHSDETQSRTEDEQPVQAVEAPQEGELCLFNPETEDEDGEWTAFIKSTEYCDLRDWI